ncbi:MAG: DoxX family protein [Thermoleophilaceae bacterium]|nr:DoxX family protein [Thermoleophilaceae bacterium]
MDLIFEIGRIMFALLFIGGGIGHFQDRAAMVAYGKTRGAPVPELVVPLTGVVIIAGGLGVMLGVFPDLAALALAFFLLPTAFIMHAFWTISDPKEKMFERAQFMKNIALCGGALVLFWVFVTAGDRTPYTITGPLL